MLVRVRQKFHYKSMQRFTFSYSLRIESVRRSEFKLAFSLQSQFENRSRKCNKMHFISSTLMGTPVCSLLETTKITLIVNGRDKSDKGFRVALFYNHLIAMEYTYIYFHPRRFFEYLVNPQKLDLRQK